MPGVTGADGEDGIPGMEGVDGMDGDHGERGPLVSGSTSCFMIYYHFITLA